MKFFVISSAVLMVAACNRSPVHPMQVSTSVSGASTQELRLPGSDHGGRPLGATLTGAAEVPGPGDPDGSGTVIITTNWGQGEICYQLTVSNIAPATAAHIHQAPAGEAGPIVFALAPPTNGSSSGCISIDRDGANASDTHGTFARRVDVFQDPSQYYVNVHNEAFPDGAIRGQLSQAH